MTPPNSKVAAAVKALMSHIERTCLIKTGAQFDLEKLISNLVVAAAEPALTTPTCDWALMDDEYMPNTYESACGETWSFTYGNLKENSVKFCQGCGKVVIENKEAI